MSKPNPIIERMKKHRFDLDTEIAELRAKLATKEAEAAILDRIMAPTPEPKQQAATPRRRIARVREHDRRLEAPDPGPTLPIAE